MKGAMAAFAEAARVLALPEVLLPGNLLVVAHGLHEAPVGHGEDLRAVNRAGIHGDAVIIGELGEDYLCLLQKGMGIFEIAVWRDGEPTHELYTEPGTPNPLVLGAKIVVAIDDLTRELSLRPLPFVGPESCFVGIASGGDFYNRFPTRFDIQGTRRYSPDRTYDEVRAELATLIEGATGIRPNEPGGAIRIDYELQRVKDGFRIGADEPIAAAVAEASRIVSGRELPPGGSSIVGDGPLFVNEAGVPAVCHGPRGHGAHADLEWVDLDELVRVAREYVVAALLYLRSA
jgi:acetylornithine deacetylase/succinyl-diaminopimelate desuccinylase-like protein